MHEVRITAPVGKAGEVVRVAQQAGIDQVSVYSVYAYGPDQTKEIISAETSTPKAKKFVDQVISASWFDAAEYSITSRQLRAIVSTQHPRELTKPMIEPPINVFEDLWQLTHVTPSYVGRAFSGAVLMAFGLIDNSPVSIVVAALFLPFLSDVLAISFGLWARDRELAMQGLKAVAVSVVCGVIAGVVVGGAYGGPVRFTDFKGPLPSFVISMLIGIAAGWSSADDAGRRYLVGVAAAVQFAIYPVWIGISLIAGFPDSHTVSMRLLTFGINVITISVAGVVAYQLLGIKRRDLAPFLKMRQQ